MSPLREKKFTIFKEIKNLRKCFCSIDADIFKCTPCDWGELFEIDGLCDVQLMGNDSRQPLKSSKIFLSSLGPKLLEILEENGGGSGIIRLPFSRAALAALNDFALTGELHCDDTTIVSTLEAAKILKIPGIRKLGGEYLMSSLRFDNALEVQRIVQKNLCHHYLSRVKLFILDHFENLGECEHFLSTCRPSQMEKLVKNKFLNADEEVVFTILLKWASKSNRNAAAMTELVTHIRFELMSDDFYGSVVKRSSYLSGSPLGAKIERIRYNMRHNGAPGRSPRIPKDFVLSLGGYAQQPTSSVEVLDIRAKSWKKIKLPIATHSYHGLALVGTGLFIMGGFGDEGDGPKHKEDVICFDLITKELSRMAPMHHPRCYVNTATVNGKIYCIGGFDGSVRFQDGECYDPETNEWTMISPMESVRSDATAVAYQEKIWIIGGFTGNEILNTTEIYDPETDQWTPGPTLQEHRSGVKAIVFDEKIFVVGGSNGHGRLASTEIMELNANQWIPGPDLSIGRSNHALAVINNQLFVFGGFDGISVINNTEMFSPSNGRFVDYSPLNVRKSALAAVTVEDLPNREDYLRRR